MHKVPCPSGRAPYTFKQMIMKYLMLMPVLLLPAISYSQTRVYTPPVDYPSANDFRVLVNGVESFVYHNRVAAFTAFSLEGEATVEVVFSGSIHEVDIRPKNLGIVPRIQEGKVLFTLDRPCNISVEINKNIKRPLFVFANSPETGIPDRNAPNVRFFEEGKFYETGRIVLKDNDIIYIAGGAVARGSLFLDSLTNVSIKGYGILDGDCIYTKGQERMIEINRSKNINIEGIIINESRHWTAPCNNSEFITYKNIKVVSGNDWDDGIDIVSSRHVLVDGCFIRSKDDCIALKAGVTYYTDFFNQYPTNDVKVVNSVLWNAEWGNGLEIGFETRAAYISDVVFSNNDLIHVEGPEGTFTIHNGDRAVVENVLYENIRVEDSRGLLVDFKILDSRYSKDKEKGHIRNITFRNISVEGDFFPPSILSGFDEQHLVENVVFENFSIHGKKVTSVADLNAETKLVEGIIFR